MKTVNEKLQALGRQRQYLHRSNLQKLETEASSTIHQQDYYQQRLLVDEIDESVAALEYAIKLLGGVME